MDSRRVTLRGMPALLAALAAVLVMSGTASADTMTALSSFPDTTLDPSTNQRGDYPTNRPAPDSVAACNPAGPTSVNCVIRARYGPYTIPAGTLTTPGQLHNLIADVPAPCQNCMVTDILPDLVDTSGNSVNLTNDLMLHHFVLINPGKADLTCPGNGQGLLGERFFAAGNERSHMHLPGNFGYENGSTPTWKLIYHLVNRGAQRSVYVQVIYRTRQLAGMQAATPAWFDIDGCGDFFSGVGDSEYTIPSSPSYSDYHDYDNAPASPPIPANGAYTADFQLPWNARLLTLAGHMHDLDITNQSPCRVHCPATTGGAIAISAELRGGPSADYFGPNPINNTAEPSDLTGATLCRSESTSSGRGVCSATAHLHATARSTG